MYQRILVASDASEGALGAVEAAAKLANQFAAELLVVHAFEPAPFYAAIASGSAVNGLECMDPTVVQEWEQGTNRLVRDRTQAVLKAHDARYRYIERRGHSAHTIVQVAEEEHCDLIVLGSRGLTGVGSFLLGSVSARVAHLAHCSILIVR